MARKKTVVKAARTRRRYTDEFKEGAVQMLLDGHTAPSVCDRLGLPHANLLYRWKQEQLTQSGPVAGVLETRVRELENELRRVERERDILTKKPWLFSAAANSRCVCGGRIIACLLACGCGFFRPNPLCIKEAFSSYPSFNSPAFLSIFRLSPRHWGLPRWFYMLTLRRIPAVPFFFIKAVMGLRPLSVRNFWWVSLLPGTAVYAGASVPKLQTLAEKGIGAVFTPSQMTQIFIAFALLGIFPLVVRILMKRPTTRTHPIASSRL